MKRSAKVGLGLVIGALAIQVVRFDRTNPPVTSEIRAPAEVKALLRRACYDCHSNETLWPWYTRVAPMSWVAHYDVSEGREELNFSEWGELPADTRAKKQMHSGDQVEEGEMPPWFYVLPAHPEARLSDAERALLVNWARGPVSP